MNSNTIEMRCSVCGQINFLNSQIAEENLYHTFCSNPECMFPITNINQLEQNYSPRRVKQYVSTVEKWARDKNKHCQSLQIQRDDLEDRCNTLIAKQNSTDADVDTATTELTRNAQTVDVSTEDFDMWLADSRLVSDIQRQLQYLTEKLNSIETDKVVQPITQFIEATDKDCTAQFNISNAQNTSNEDANKQSLNLQDIDRQAYDVAHTLELEQLHASKSQWLELYNSNLAQFIDQFETQLVGTSKETLEASRLNRLIQQEDALFETGNGNYWLMISNHQKVAFLMPNRRRIRFNQNVLESVKICFQLTHYSIEDLTFSVKNTDFNQFRMLTPAIVDSVSDRLWRLRQKGILLFPSKA